MSAVSAAGIALVGCATSTAAGAGRSGPANESEEAEVTPGEDLMQEHGVLERILLIYDEAASRIEQNEQFELDVVVKAAGIVRRFVEDYHEQHEEQFVFPRLQQAGVQKELVAILLAQHRRGREVTDLIVQRAGAAQWRELSPALRSFVRMYRPHAAREETVLFPAFRNVIGRAGYRELGEQFEQREHQLFGRRGFEDTVAAVARLEAAFGIQELASFTPA
ncbi:MAG TPA: hemerythrin domain-containing protein [Polyangiales bacterium]|nr:hemerythrin domain-containing protein [Polyangiales bacterium]